MKIPKPVLIILSHISLFTLGIFGNIIATKVMTETGIEVAKAFNGNIWIYALILLALVILFDVSFVIAENRDTEKAINRAMKKKNIPVDDAKTKRKIKLIEKGKLDSFILDEMAEEMINKKNL